MAAFTDHVFDQAPPDFQLPIGQAVYQVEKEDINICMDGPELQMRALKPSVKDKVMRLNRRVVMDYVFSAATNLSVYALIIALIVIVPATSYRHLNTGEIASLVILACMAVPMYVFFNLREGFRLRSVIAHVLRNQISQEELRKLLFDRTKASPVIEFKISLKRGAISREQPDHWTQKDRYTTCSVPYSSWQDRSKSVRDLPLQEGKSTWIIVAKDFCSRNKPTDQSISSDIAKFKKESSFDSYLYFMEAEFILEYEDMKTCDDWELYFIFDKQSPGWASMRIYQVLCFLSLDSVYRTLFHCLTDYLDEFYVTKVIER